MSKKRLFNDNWNFTKQPVHTPYKRIIDKSILWSPVNLPHDWLIYDTKNLYETSGGWYRKYMDLPETLTNNRTSLRFEGVYMDSTIYINGEVAGIWKYGYSTFEFDITDYLKTGTNEIMVEVVHESPNSRWYSGAGIYRNVWIKTYPNTYLVSDGIYISTKKEDNEWIVDVTTEVSHSNQTKDSNLKLCQSLYDNKGNLIIHSESLLLSMDEKDGNKKYTDILRVSNPNLWDINTPILYHLQTRLLLDEQILDEETQTFGFRTLGFNCEEGFFLNGSHVKLYGVCQHHDLGCLGAAVNKVALKRQLVLLQEMGVNAIRTSHNMPAVELMELADEMGILIISEAFDMWERKKTSYDYARFFPEWIDKDVASWIRRDRNRPSVIMWSIGNEIYDTHADERGQEVTIMLRDLVLEHDPKENAPITIGSNYMPWKNAQKCADILKYAGYNYAERYYDKHHAEHPDWIIYGSETASTVQSRGIYHFPLAQSVLADDDEQCSSLGNSSTSWGAKNTESCIIDDRNASFSLGQFIWTGFDYIGEPTPYHTKNSYFGQIDTAGFKKDSFYIYQAEWTSYKDNPMIHIFPYWDFSNGQLIDIRVCSNAPKIELFFNDISQGTVDIDHAHGDKLLGEWQLFYKEGTLRAVAYDEDGTIIAEDRETSFTDATSLLLSPDKTQFLANGSDLIFIEISATDMNGNPVLNANNRVYVTVDGAACLVGLDNGDSTDYDQYKSYSRRLFSGKLLAVVSSTFDSGEITLSVSSEGMETQEVKFKSLDSEIIEGSCEPFEYPKSNLISEVPIRKLEIICPEGNKLNKDTPSVTASVLLHPLSATYQDIEWRITNVAGIDTNIATIETEAGGKSVKLTALGDGIVYLRCSTKNGGEKTQLYSLMEFTISDIGAASLNPYDFISAGLYSYGSKNLTNGNDRGVATARDSKSTISFERLDFGDFGSDEITLPIFALDGGEVPIEIWEGIPEEENSTLLTKVIYHKPSIWNTYQEETYKLPKRLKGISTLSFVLNQKVHIKGFTFKKYEKAFEKLSILEYDNIYGDSFTLTDSTIKDIGNNVSIEFDNMDFGVNGASKLVICGHSPLDKNTIQIRFSGENEDTAQLIEFIYSDDYLEREFSLIPITAKGKITFVFLPGCQFDFNCFQFLS
ncbi:MAG: DUF4982 domain-containing protein [Clostridiales bacterium]|nr:DUF4982 domain-containing protein [Clostridiales bacterium]